MPQPCTIGNQYVGIDKKVFFVREELMQCGISNYNSNSTVMSLGVKMCMYTQYITRLHV